jgi:hypothetical protein
MIEVSHRSRHQRIQQLSRARSKRLAHAALHTLMNTRPLLALSVGGLGAAGHGDELHRPGGIPGAEHDCDCHRRYQPKGVARSLRPHTKNKENTRKVTCFHVFAARQLTKQMDIMVIIKNAHPITSRVPSSKVNGITVHDRRGMEA